jgi:hypothetical protein
MASGSLRVAENGGAMSMLEMASVLKARLGEAAKKVPTRELPRLDRPGRCDLRSRHAPAAADAGQGSQRDSAKGAAACSPGSRARARTHSLRRRRVY